MNNTKFFLKEKPIARKFLKYAGSVDLALASFVFISPPVQALDLLKASSAVIATEGVKSALTEAVKFTKSRSGLGIAMIIVCGLCILTAGAPAAGSATMIAGRLLLGNFLNLIK